MKESGESTLVFSIQERVGSTVDEYRVVSKTMRENVGRRAGTECKFGFATYSDW